MEDDINTSYRLWQSGNRLRGYAINLMECPVKGAQAAKTTGKTYFRHRHLGVRQQTHGMFGTELFEIIIVGTAEFVLKYMRNMIFTVAQCICKLRQTKLLREMHIQVI